MEKGFIIFLEENIELRKVNNVTYNRSYIEKNGNKAIEFMQGNTVRKFSSPDGIMYMSSNRIIINCDFKSHKKARMFVKMLF